MKFSVILSLAFAAVTVANDFADNVTARDLTELDFPITSEDIILTERDLDMEEGLIEYDEFTKRFTPPNIKPVSTTCAAVPRRNGGAPGTCGVSGHLKHPTSREIIHNVIFQRCANTCACRAASNNNCKTFTWVANPKEGEGRGRCVLFSADLAQMGFVPGAGRTFYQRSCYHRGKPPTTTGVHTELAAQATPAPEKRDIDLGAREALAGILGMS